MSDTEDQLAKLQANNTAAADLASQDATALAALEADLANTAPTAADNVLTAVVSAVNTVGIVEVFGTDTLVAALTADGFTVTPPAEPEIPATDIPVTDGTDPNATA